MCYNAKTSALAATIGILSAVVAFYIKEPVLGLFIITYSLMQISEFCIWRGLDTDSFRWNRGGTALAATSLKLHALVVVSALILFRWTSLKQNRTKLISLLAILILTLILSLKELLVPVPSTTQPSCSKGCRLNWKFGASYPIQVVLICAALFIGAPEIFIPVATFYFGVLIAATILSYFDPKTTLKTAVSSVWCLFTAIFAPLLVGYLWWNKSRS